jgi:hypothetical protein
MVIIEVTAKPVYMHSDIKDYMLKSGMQTQKDTSSLKFKGARTLIQKLIQLEAQILALNDRYIQGQSSPIKAVFFFATNGLPLVEQVRNFFYI